MECQTQQKPVEMVSTLPRAPVAQEWSQE